MTPENQERLIDAFKRQTVLAMHIDLQRYYYEHYPHTQSAYAVTKRLSRNFRSANVPNIWIAYIEDHKPARLTIGEFNKKEGSDFPADGGLHIVNPPAHETVLTKNCTSAFIKTHEGDNGWGEQPNTVLLDLLEEKKAETLLFTGVKANVCVRFSIIGATLWNSEALIIPVHDATNLLSGMNETYQERLRNSAIRENPSYNPQNIECASAAEITDCLSKAAPKPALTA